MRQVTITLFVFVFLTTLAFANGYEHYPQVCDWSADSKSLVVAFPDDFDGYVNSGRLVIASAWRSGMARRTNSDHQL